METSLIDSALHEPTLKAGANRNTETINEFLDEPEDDPLAEEPLENPPEVASPELSEDEPIDDVAEFLNDSGGVSEAPAAKNFEDFFKDWDL